MYKPKFSVLTAENRVQIPEDWFLWRKASLEWLNSGKITILAVDSSKLVTQLSLFSLSSRKIASWVQTVDRWPLVTHAGFALLIGWSTSRIVPQAAHPQKNVPRLKNSCIYVSKHRKQTGVVSNCSQFRVKPNRSLLRLKLMKTCWKLGDLLLKT